MLPPDTAEFAANNRAISTRFMERVNAMSSVIVLALKRSRRHPSMVPEACPPLDERGNFLRPRLTYQFANFIGAAKDLLCQYLPRPIGFRH